MGCPYAAARTTGQPVGVPDSARELGMLSSRSALGFLLGNQLTADNVVYLCADGRGIGAITPMAMRTRGGFTVLVALEPRTVLQYAGWRRREPERTTRQYRVSGG